MNVKLLIEDLVDVWNMMSDDEIYDAMEKLEEIIEELNL